MAVEAQRSYVSDEAVLPRSVASPRRVAGDIPTGTVTATAQAIVGAVSRVLRGRKEAAELAVVVLLAEGHMLIEDVPGVGKTTLAKALAAAIDCPMGRIQFTPDLLPSDVLGANVFHAERGDFEFLPGVIFNTIVIGDEINRASPKTQSALLEAMQERHVTVDGTTYPLPDPFVVIATQNPIEMEGTYALPEAERDRFMARLAIGYPAFDDEVDMLDLHELVDPLDDCRPVTTGTAVAQAIARTRALYVAPALKRYIISLAEATRRTPEFLLGASPRAAIQLLRASKAAAAIAGRDHVIPDDIQRLAPTVWAHRMVMARQSRGRAVEDVLASILEHVPIR